MQPQQIALLVIIILGVAEVLSSLRRPGGADRTGLKILIRAREHPQLAEGLVRYLLWELTLLKGLDVEISLELDAPCEEMQVIQTVLMEEGLVSEARFSQPDLVFVL